MAILEDGPVDRGLIMTARRSPTASIMNASHPADFSINRFNGFTGATR
jgi:hypothetical protein